ncbi:MAG: hypothetical protein DRH12_07290 [Deltaproteobacteria bacterium]|nr:MAG: hypothetical protein DRH12_07290 [Deltaproteobacteria bacterium]
MAEFIIAVTLAILISAGCSLMEAVLYSVPMRHVEAAAQAGKPGAGIFKALRQNIERPIAAILSLNTIANTAGAAIAGAAAAAVFGHQWLGYFSVLFTLAILLFSEIIPKTAGVVYGPRLIPTVAYALKGLVHIMTPAIWFTNLVTRLVARGKTEGAITAEELRIMARLSLRSGEINPYQEQVIENILTLQNKAVKDVMTPRTVIFSLSEHLTVKEAAHAPPKWEHSRFPVYDRDPEDIVGIVLTRELFVALTQGKEDMKLTDLMRPVHFVVETAKLNNVFIEFLERKEHLFVVLDEYGGIAGLITLEDVLEEILGREIVDEFDEVEDKRELARRQRKMLVGEY